jgi:hypothetical protein
VEEKRITKNGVNIFGYRNPSLHGFFISLFLRAGSMYESERDNGITHFFEHISIRNVNRLMDGALYSNKATGLVAGLYFSDNDGKILWDGVGYSESDGCATLRVVSKKGSVCISFSEVGIEIRTDVPDLFLLPLCDASVFSGGEVSADEKLVDYNSDDAKISMPSGIFADGDTVKISFNGREYGVKIACGTLGDGFCVYPDDGVIGLSFELY